MRGYHAADAEQQERLEMANQPVVSIEKWLTDGWRLYKKRRFTFSFAGFLAALICIPTGVILFCPPLYAGYYYMALKSMRGQKPRIRDIFKGFGRYWAAFFLWMTFLGTGILLCTTGIGLLFVPFVWALSMLAFPLLIDKQLSVGAAFETAFRTVFQWNGFGESVKRCAQFWLYGLAMVIISFMGILGFGVGVLITLPFAVCAQVAAYRDIFLPEETLRAETAETWLQYPFRLSAKYVGPIARLRELRDRIFEQIHSANDTVKTLLGNTVEHLNAVFAKAANLVYRLQQVEDYLQTTSIQKLHAEREEIIKKMAEAPNIRVMSQYQEALNAIDERIEHHEQIKDLAAQINAQLTTIRISLDNTHAKIIRIKTSELSNVRFESDDVSKELRELQIEMDALLSSLDEMAKAA
jgi:hypothetical protein